MRSPGSTPGMRETGPPSARTLRAQHRQLQRDLAQALAGDEGALRDLLRRCPEGQGLQRLRDPERARTLLLGRLLGRRRRLDALGPGLSPGSVPLPVPAPSRRAPPRPDHEQALRGRLLRLRLRLEEAARVRAIYGRVGAHLQAEAGVSRGLLTRLEEELERERRRLRELREQRRDPPPQEPPPRPQKQREPPRSRGTKGVRSRAPKEPTGPLSAPSPAPPTPEGGREDPLSPPPETPSCGTPPKTPLETSPRSTDPAQLRVPQQPSPRRGGVRPLSPSLLRELREEAAALRERLERLRRQRERQREGLLQEAAALEQRLGQEQRLREGARGALAEVTLALGSASAGLRPLSHRLLPGGLEDDGTPTQPPSGDPQTLPQLLEGIRAGLAALRGGPPRGQHPPISTPQQPGALLQRDHPDPEDPLIPSPISDDDAAGPPVGVPLSRTAIKRQSRLLLEGRRGVRGLLA